MSGEVFNMRAGLWISALMLTFPLNATSGELTPPADRDELPSTKLVPVSIHGDGDERFHLNYGRPFASGWQYDDQYVLIPAAEGPLVTFVVTSDRVKSRENRTENCYQIEIPFWRTSTAADAARLLSDAKSLEFKRSDFSVPLSARKIRYNSFRRIPSEFGSSCIIYRLSSDDIILHTKGGSGPNRTLDQALVESRSQNQDSIRRSAISAENVKSLSHSGDFDGVKSPEGEPGSSSSAAH